MDSKKALMKQMKLFFAFTLSLLFTFFHSELTGAADETNQTTVVYKEKNQEFEGIFFASKQNNAPGIVLIHNWMGVTEESEKQAKRFQALGYNVFVADIYGKGIRPKDSKEAGGLAGKYKTDRNLLRERVNLAITELKKIKGVNLKKIAVLGYCFGGTAALEVARSGADIQAVISFHGGLDSPDPTLGKNIKARILALHGADDPFVPVKDIGAFESEMKTHKVSYELVSFPGAVHSFTDVGAGSDNSKGAAYNSDADQKSFERAKNFLKTTL